MKFIPPGFDQEIENARGKREGEGNAKPKREGVWSPEKAEKAFEFDLKCTRKHLVKILLFRAATFLIETGELLEVEIAEGY